jgi:hypothetical protein
MGMGVAGSGNRVMGRLTIDGAEHYRTTYQCTSGNGQGRTDVYDRDDLSITLGSSKILQFHVQTTNPRYSGAYFGGLKLWV